MLVYRGLYSGELILGGLISGIYSGFYDIHTKQAVKIFKGILHTHPHRYLAMQDEFVERKHDYDIQWLERVLQNARWKNYDWVIFCPDFDNKLIPCG